MQRHGRASVAHKHAVTNRIFLLFVSVIDGADTAVRRHCDGAFAGLLELWEERSQQQVAVAGDLDGADLLFVIAVALVASKHDAVAGGDQIDDPWTGFVGWDRTVHGPCTDHPHLRAASVAAPAVASGIEAASIMRTNAHRPRFAVTLRSRTTAHFQCPL